MRLQRRSQFERLRFTTEVPKAQQTPFIAPNLYQGEFVTADVKRSTVPTIDGLHLDQPLAAIDLKTGNVATNTIAIFFRNPTLFSSQIVEASGGKHRSEGETELSADKFIAAEGRYPVFGLARRNRLPV